MSGGEENANIIKKIIEEVKKDKSMPSHITLAKTGKFMEVNKKISVWTWDKFKTSNGLKSGSWLTEKRRDYLKLIDKQFGFDFNNPSSIVKQLELFLKKYPLFQCDTIEGVIYIIGLTIYTYTTEWQLLIQDDSNHEIFHSLQIEEQPENETSDFEIPELKPRAINSQPETKPEPIPEPKQKPKKGQKTIRTKTTETTITENTN